jgi:hypothetical protein
MNRNPLINLTLSQVNCYDVLGALSQQSGLTIEFARLNENASEIDWMCRGIESAALLHNYSWDKVPLADCLRELCKRTGLVALSGGESIRIWPHGPESVFQPGADESPLRFEADDVIIYPLYASMDNTRSLNFTNGAVKEERNKLFCILWLLCAAMTGNGLPSLKTWR